MYTPMLYITNAVVKANAPPHRTRAVCGVRVKPVVERQAPGIAAYNRCGLTINFIWRNAFLWNNWYFFASSRQMDNCALRKVHTIRLHSWQIPRKKIIPYIVNGLVQPTD